jgi:hypothetical protein
MVARLANRSRGLWKRDGDARHRPASTRVLHLPAQSRAWWEPSMGKWIDGNLSNEKAVRMMVALRNGETLRQFSVHSLRLKAYFEAHPQYAQEARPLIEANAKAALLRKGVHRGKTHCKYGHPWFGKTVYRLRTCIAISWRALIIWAQIGA